MQVMIFKTLKNKGYSIKKILSTAINRKGRVLAELTRDDIEFEEEDTTYGKINIQIR